MGKLSHRAIPKAARLHSRTVAPSRLPQLLLLNPLPVLPRTHGGSRGFGLLGPVGPVCSVLLEVEPGSPEARSLPTTRACTNTHTHTHTLWVPRVCCHPGLMEHTYHACSFSAPPLAQARRGSPGRCCVSSRTTPAAPGQGGSSAGKEARGGQGGRSQCEGACVRGVWGKQSALHIPSLTARRQLSWHLPLSCGSSLSPKKAMLGSGSASCPQQAAQTQDTNTLLPFPCPGFLSSVGTELPPSHASAPKLTATERKPCSKQK